MNIINLLLVCLSLRAAIAQQCTGQCGTAPSRPTVLCPDGTSYSGPGPCAYNRTSRRCEWTTLTCPRTCNSSTCKFGATCSVVNGLATCSCAGRVCSTLFNPVCGSDGNTYPNSCSLGIKTCETQGQVTQVSTGECPPLTSPSCAVVDCITGSICREVNGRPVCECIDVCTLESDPRCGSDGITYGNGCLMSQKICQSNGAVSEAHTGACEPPTSTSCAATTCLVGSICEEVNGRAVCKCAETCTEEYNPVCGSDGNTYGNPCLMGQKICQSQGQVTQASEGECVLPVQCQTIRCGWGSTCKVVNGQATCDCPRICTREYNPICGTDGVTYGNPCEMQYAYCNSRGQITQDHEGACQTANSTCPSGVPQVRCLVDPCRSATCPANPNARCVANYCGGCFADFYDSNNRKVNCTLSGNNCPNHDAVNCLVDGCFHKTCTANPNATCVSNNCGGCNWVFINRQGYPVDCGDSTPEQACTVSDWASHLSDWSYQRKTTFREVFNVSVNGNPTLKTIIQSTDQSLQLRFLREAVAALLNSATSWNYRYSTQEVILMVQQAFANSKKSETLDLFLSANNVGNCPL